MQGADAPLVSALKVEPASELTYNQGHGGLVANG